MTHRQISLIVAILGGLMIIFGWVKDERYTFAFGAVAFIVAVIIGVPKHDQVNYPPAQQSNQAEMNLSELIKACVDEITLKNIWPNNKSGKFYFFTLSPIINTSGLNLRQVGNITRWRATIEYGHHFDEIDQRGNFFGDTPEQAMSKFLSELRKPKEHSFISKMREQ